jgi:hypothetical protein
MWLRGSVSYLDLEMKMVEVKVVIVRWWMDGRRSVQLKVEPPAAC